MAVLNAFSGIFTIITLIAMGMLIVSQKLMTQEIYSFLSRFLMRICVPALLFENALKNVTWEFINSMGLLLLVPFVAQFINYLIAVLCARLFKIPQKDRGVFIAIFSVANTIFIGLPVATAIYGEPSIPFTTAAFIANTVCFWSLVVPGIAADGTGAKVSLSHKLKQVFSAPLLAFLIGSAINLIGIPLPSFFTKAVGYMGGVVTPLSMLLIAYLLWDMGKSAFKLSRNSIIAICGRYLVSPVIGILVCLLFSVPSDIAKVFTVVATMPVMNQAVILASAYKANDKMAAQALAFTCVMATAVIPILVFVLELIFV